MSAMTNARDKAKARGDSRFKMTEPCRNGHISERLVSNMTCCQCSAEYRPKYQQENMQKWEEYRASNREVLADNARAYRRENRAVISGKDVARRRIKRKEDPVFALAHRLRARIAMAYKGSLKPASTMRLIGCSFEEFARHIESQFEAGMTWSNRGAWHVDHKTPISAFDLQTEAGALAAFHWSNCQPLWAIDNLKKGSRTINSDMLKVGAL